MMGHRSTPAEYHYDRDMDQKTIRPFLMTINAAVDYDMVPLKMSLEKFGRL